MSRQTTATLLLATLALIAPTANAQTPEQNVNVTIKSSQTVEERVADEVKLNELRKAAAEKIASEEAAKIAETSPKALLQRARLVFIDSNTSFFESVQLENALRKRAEFDNWQMAVIGSWDKRNVADMIIEIDRPLFTYTFTYKLTSRSTGIILATGKVTAFDSNDAAPKLAQRIIEEIKIARGESKARK